jgi:hypothetical protein
MRRHTTTVLLALCGLAWWPAGAQTAAPEPTLREALQNHGKLGTARLRYWGFDVYDANLYAPAGFDIQRFEGQRFGLELSYLRGFKGIDIAERSIDEMKGLAAIEPAHARARPRRAFLPQRPAARRDRRRRLLALVLRHLAFAQDFAATPARSADPVHGRRAARTMSTRPAAPKGARTAVRSTKVHP